MSFAWLCGNGVIVRPSKMEDVTVLKDCLRDSDVAEIWASNRHIPEMALKEGLDKSETCLTLESDGKPVSMFGVAPCPTLKGRGIIWMLASDDIKRVRFAFLRYSRRIIALMMGERFGTVCNFVDDRNKASIKWLKWCGAEMSTPHAYGPDDRLFRYFEIRRD